MVKRNNKAKKSRANGKAPDRRPNGKVTLVRQLRSRLDKGALDWMRLLEDPCNAPLVRGCFPGLSGGMLYRTRSEVGVGATARDSMIFFHPSGNTSSNYYPIQWASSNTTGAAPVTSYGTAISGAWSAGSQVRCVAACIKVRYTNSEYDRAGIVGHIMTNDPPFLNGIPGGTATTLPNCFAVRANAQTVYRLGEAAHEVRWLPTFEDGNFIEDPIATYNTGNSIGFVVTGAPEGSIYYEVTAVWEVIPATGSNLVPSLAPPPSNNTLNDVLRAIGDVGKWATDPQNFSFMRKIAMGGALGVRALSQAGSSLASVAPLMLTM